MCVSLLMYRKVRYDVWWWHTEVKGKSFYVTGQYLDESTQQVTLVYFFIFDVDVRLVVCVIHNMFICLMLDMSRESLVMMWWWCDDDVHTQRWRGSLSPSQANIWTRAHNRWLLFIFLYLMLMWDCLMLIVYMFDVRYV